MCQALFRTVDMCKFTLILSGARWGGRAVLHSWGGALVALGAGAQLQPRWAPCTQLCPVRQAGAQQGCRLDSPRVSPSLKCRYWPLPSLQGN